jgi:hypothetical protein
VPFSCLPRKDLAVFFEIRHIPQDGIPSALLVGARMNLNSLEKSQVYRWLEKPFSEPALISQPFYHSNLLPRESRERFGETRERDSLRERERERESLEIASIRSKAGRCVGDFISVRRKERRNRKRRPRDDKRSEARGDRPVITHSFIPA